MLLVVEMTNPNLSSKWLHWAEHHLLFISDPSTDKRHVKGESNQGADALPGLSNSLSHASYEEDYTIRSSPPVYFYLR